MAERAAGIGATVRTLAGIAGKEGHADGAAGEAQFKCPFSVAADGEGGLLVADRTNHCIRRVSADGTQVTTVAGIAGKEGHADGAAGEAQFNQPYGVAVDGEGGLLVADKSNHCIRRVSADGTQVTTVAGIAGKEGHADGAAGEAQFNNPRSVAVDGEGGLLVADADNHCIRRVSADGTQVTTVAGIAGKQGHADGAAGEAQFKYPFGVAVDGEGGLLVADQYNHCIRRVSADGTQVTTVAGIAGKDGHADGAAGEAQFKYPCGVAVDGEGGLLVADADNHCIRRVSADGTQVTTVAGIAGKKGHADGAAGEAQFNCPYGVAVDGEGGLLVVDSNNHCIRVIEGLGILPAKQQAAAPPAVPEPEAHAEGEPAAEATSPFAERLASMSKPLLDQFAEKLSLDDAIDEAEDMEGTEDKKAFLLTTIVDELQPGGKLHKAGIKAIKDKAADLGLSADQIKEASRGAEDRKAAVLQLIFDTIAAEISGGGAGGTASGSLTASEATLQAQGFSSLSAEQRQQIVQEALDGKRQGQWQTLKPLGKGGQAMVYHITPAATATAGSSPRGSGSRVDRAFKVVPYVGVDTKGKLERCVSSIYLFRSILLTWLLSSEFSCD
eukprot:COSAG06_NODE_642_length_13482_cov_21.927296_16_plen_611_part_00